MFSGSQLLTYVVTQSVHAYQKATGRCGHCTPLNDIRHKLSFRINLRIQLTL